MSFFKKKSFALCASVGEGCALVLTALLLLPLAWAVSCRLLPRSAGGICVPAAAGLAVLLSTAVIARTRGKQAMATGGAIGGGYVALAVLLCALGGAKNAFGLWLAYLAGAAAAGALGGALLAVRQNRHKKRRH